MLGFTETILRDANQSLAATRLGANDFSGILDEINRAGYYSVECWGGATFDSCIRYLSEDPWERLRYIKKHLPNTKLQMLLRGQNLLGYTHYPTQIVKEFVGASIKNGIDIIRIFDALNDTNNIRDALEATLEFGGHPSCAICYTVSPVHNVKSFVDLAFEMENMGAQSICVKDMSGCLLPDAAYELICRLKERLAVPIILHSHCSSGMAPMTYLKAIEAGVDIVDTAVSCFSGGTSQPATETIALVAKAIGKRVDLDLDVVEQINNHFIPVFDDMMKRNVIDYHSLQTDTKSLVNQIPGGMYSNLITQMKNQGMLDKLGEVLDEVPLVRKDLGYPPLVTPISQMVGTQALANVISGKRYSVVVNEVKAYLMGEYGRAPGKINIDAFGDIINSHKVVKKHFDETSEYDSKIADGYSVEDALTCTLFPQLAENFFKRKERDASASFRFECTDCKENLHDYKLVNIDDDTSALLIAIISNYLAVDSDSIKLKNVWKL